MDKYTKDNIKIDYFVSTNSHESEIYVSKYVTETWNFDGLVFSKATKDESATTKVPAQTFAIDEFMSYVDELVRMRDYLIQRKPIIITSS